MLLVIRPFDNVSFITQDKSVGSRWRFHSRMFVNWVAKMDRLFEYANPNTTSFPNSDATKAKLSQHIAVQK